MAPWCPERENLAGEPRSQRADEAVSNNPNPPEENRPTLHIWHEEPKSRSIADGFGRSIDLPQSPHGPSRPQSRPSHAGLPPHTGCIPRDHGVRAERGVHGGWVMTVKHHCSFCGAHQDDREAFIHAKASYICEVCIVDSMACLTDHFAQKLAQQLHATAYMGQAMSAAIMMGHHA